MAKLLDKLLILVTFMQVLCIDTCEAYSYSYSWWSMWYFWVILFGVLSCCCGAAGSYYRRKQLARAQAGRARGRIVVVGTATTAANMAPTMSPQGPVVYPSAAIDPYAPPVYPPPTVPIQPPTYTEGVGNNAFNSAGDNKDSMPPPPAYSEICGQKLAENT